MMPQVNTTRPMEAHVPDLWECKHTQPCFATSCVEMHFALLLIPSPWCTSADRCSSSCDTFLQPSLTRTSTSTRTRRVCCCGCGHSFDSLLSQRTRRASARRHVCVCAGFGESLTNFYRCWRREGTPSPAQCHQAIQHPHPRCKCPSLMLFWVI
jgi:hypothetical protein